jgi:hypothetical protein
MASVSVSARVFARFSRDQSLISDPADQTSAVSISASTQSSDLSNEIPVYNSFFSRESARDAHDNVPLHFQPEIATSSSGPIGVRKTLDDASDC